MGRNRGGHLPQMRRVTKGRNEYARVRVGGRDHFLGKWGSPEAQAAYDAILLVVIEARRSGRITSTCGNALQAVRALRPFDQTPAHLFGPKKLKAVMDDLVREGRPRVGVNRIAKAIRRLFGWAVAAASKAIAAQEQSSGSRLECPKNWSPNRRLTRVTARVPRRTAAPPVRAWASRTG